MKRLLTICAVMTIIICASSAMANTTASSTLWFHGDLDGNYEGTLAMTAGNYYVPGGQGEGISTAGGFDVYAEEGGTANITGYYGATSPAVGSYVIGSDHDAYSSAGPWGSWYDPDCADYGQFQLVLSSNHWSLEYKDNLGSPGNSSPMSGTLVWTTPGVVGYAYETDLGTQYGNHGGSSAYGGGAGAWDWDCGWGIEVVPLQYSTFAINVTSGSYTVSLTPVPAPGAILLGAIGVGIVGWLKRRRAL